MDWWETGLDLVGLGRTGLDWSGQSSWILRSSTTCHTLPGVILPVRPSTLLIWRRLQKFDPSTTRQEPSATRQENFTARTPINGEQAEEREEYNNLTH
jgi:hypothetical protein